MPASYRTRDDLKTDTTATARSLVLEYLTCHGYIKSSQAFIRDTSPKHLDADGDEVVYALEAPAEKRDELEVREEEVALIMLRKALETEILNGDIPAATHLLETHFPTVLSAPDVPSRTSITPAPTFSPGDFVMSNLSSLRARPPTSSQPQTGSRPQGETNASSQPPRPFTFTTSLEPAHIALNLRILGFLEELRAGPVEDDPLLIDTTETSSSTTVGMSAPTPISVPSGSAGTKLKSTEHHAHLINIARKLLASAKALPDPSDRQAYEQELRNVWSLLAYTNPSSAPAHLRRYLDQVRREAVAAQVNAAILKSKDLRPAPRIEALARYTTAIWAQLHAMGVQVNTADAPRPTRPYVPSSSSTSTPAQASTASVSVAGAEQNANNRADPEGGGTERMAAPTFDLGTFVDPARATAAPETQV